MSERIQDEHERHFNDTLWRMEAARPFIYVPAKDQQPLPASLDELFAELKQPTTEAPVLALETEDKEAMEWRTESEQPFVYVTSKTENFTSRTAKSAKQSRLNTFISSARSKIAGLPAVGSTILEKFTSAASAKESGKSRRLKTALAGASLAIVASLLPATPVSEVNTSNTTSASLDIGEGTPESEVVLESAAAVAGQAVSTHFIETSYQDDFELGISDATVTYSAIKKVLEAASDKGEISNIELVGLASAEDEAEDGGLDSPSQNNLKLAEQRAELAENILLNNFDIDASVLSVGAHEQSLTQLQLDSLEQMARSTDFADAGQMVEAYNDGLITDRSSKNYLESLLGSHRGVSLKITVSN